MVILDYAFVDIDISKGLSFCNQDGAFGGVVSRFFTVQAQLVGSAVCFFFICEGAGFGSAEVHRGRCRSCGGCRGNN